MHIRFAILVSSFLLCLAAHAAEIAVSINAVDETGTLRRIGSVTISETSFGLLFTPQIEGLPPGVHGFHVHENGSCEPQVRDGKPVAALAAGGHYDPAGTKRHGTPWGDGHLGDQAAIDGDLAEFGAFIAHDQDGAGIGRQDLAVGLGQRPRGIVEQGRL